MATCPRCASINGVQRKFCLRCGQSLKAENSIPTPRPEGPRHPPRRNKDLREDAGLGETFSYFKYIEKVDVRTLLDRQIVPEESRTRAKSHANECFKCRRDLYEFEAIRLNNKKLLCTPCLEEIQTTRYPEKYQKSYEEYLAKKEARRLAKHDFIERLPATSLINQWSVLKRRISVVLSFALFLGVLATLFAAGYRIQTLSVTAASCVVLFIPLLCLTYFLENQNRIKEERIRSWDEENPPPPAPILKEFHDPSAQLSPRDKLVVQVFDYWPGYPPYWKYVRQVVFSRDGAHCQISGCPSRTELHVHHKIPISSGGSHKPENLVPLCEFHHGLQPDEGHERIWGKIINDYFIMVRAHYRRGFPVQAHVRRRELIAEHDLAALFEHYKLSCCDCADEALTFTVHQPKQEVTVRCSSCGSTWCFERKLAEETGPQMANELKIGAYAGKWHVDPQLTTTSRKPRYRPGRKPLIVESKN